MASFILSFRRLPAASRSVAQRRLSTQSPRRIFQGVAAVCQQPNLHNGSRSGRKIHVLSSRTTVRFYYNTPALWKDYPEHTLFPMPALSPTMESGTIASWTMKEGDEFSAGDVLCSIETDKASVDFEAQDDGILAKILREGKNAEDIPIGTPICVVVEEADDVAAFADFTVDEGDAAAAAAAPSSTEAPAASAPAAAAAPAATSSGEPSPLMPAARHLSESKGLDATVLKGTEPAAAAAASAPAAAAAAPPPTTTAAADDSSPLEEITTQGKYEDVPNNKMRKVIASRLTQSKREVPHFYTTVEVELDNVLAMRKKFKDEYDVKVSVNDFVIRCCAMALRDVPEVNSFYNEATDQVKLQDTIDVSVAVATDTGLITPIVPNTDRKRLSAISAEVRDLALRARDGKLQPHEYQGGTFCVSNLGMFGISEFSAVINPPQAAILAVGAGAKRLMPGAPFVLDAPEDEERPPPVMKTIMTGRLSADRRVVDEPTAALFLMAFRYYFSEPELLLL